VQQFFRNNLDYRLAKTWQQNYSDCSKNNNTLNFPQTAAEWLIYVTIPGPLAMSQDERIAIAEKNFEKYSKFFPKAVNF